MIYRPHTFHKYFLKMDNEPKYKTVKHIDDNTGDTDLGLGNDVLDTTPKYNPWKKHWVIWTWLKFKISVQQKTLLKEYEDIHHVIRELQMKETTIYYYYIPTWMAKPKTLTSNTDKNMEQQELSATVGGNAVWYSHFRRQFFL